jgi:hypothetical protein
MLRDNNRGLPLSPIQATCIALNHFGGGNFIRIAAYCGNVSYTCAWKAVNRVRNAICRLQERVIRMPNEIEMAATAERIQETRTDDSSIYNFFFYNNFN